MTKRFDAPVPKTELPDPATVQAAQVKANQQAQDNCPRRGGISGRLKIFPGNH